MIIPLGTDRPLRRPTLVNHALIALNIAVYFAQVLGERFAPEAAEQARTAFHLDPRALVPWSMITYAFLHADLWHLLGNMVFLWVFGPNVEDRLGRVGYLLFYIGAAGVSGGLHAIFEQAPVIGASGAIAGVTGAYMVLFPYTHIRCFVLFFMIGVFAIPAIWFIGGQIAYNVFMQATAIGGPVAVLAHLGGYGFGLVLSLTLLGFRVLAREPYDLFTISRQAARRRQFREIRYQQERSQARPDPKPTRDPASEALAAARSEVTTLIAAGNLVAAAESYRNLLRTRGLNGAMLSRRAQYDLANHLFRDGDHQTAATAYELFLKGYPSDSETPVVHLMLGLINARYLNDPIRAKSEIDAAVPHLPEGEHKTLARELLAELGVTR